MKNFLDKFFSRSKNLDYISQNLKQITLTTPANKIFEAINNFSEKSEIRYVGGCVRKVIKKENVDDIDLATNLTPLEVCEALKNKQISYYETGIEHGTITAIIDEYKYEITSLRKDVSTDGRHAEIEFSLDWKEDASRRDFTINSIYADGDGNLFDPFNGKKDLEEGYINFIGNAEKRIQEDYLRILRYLRFYLNYSNHKHQPEIIKNIKKNIDGISNISSERLIDELKKITCSNGFLKLFKDKESLELIEIIFPQLKNIKNFKKQNSYAAENFLKIDFIFLIALLVIDGTDNADYFLYKFKISNKDKKRLKLIQNELFNHQSLKNKMTENTLVNVLVENKIRNQNKYFGRTEYMTAVIFDGEKNIEGKIVPVLITSSNQNNLFGEIKLKKRIKAA